MPDEETITSELHRRMDTQDTLLREIRDTVVKHIAEDETQKQAIQELVVLWRGSKILIPILVGLAGIVVTCYMWAKDHIK